MTNYVGGIPFEPMPGEAVNEIHVRVQIETNFRVITEHFRGESGLMSAEAWADDIREQLA